MDAISGVSGGSFPAGYYGLFGDRIFDEFEERFLRKDIQGALVRRILAPWNLVRLPGPNMSRTQLARDYYDKHVFEHATFADLANAKGPRIYINTTDLVQGNRFTFDQTTFDTICSDLDPLPVSAATAASSAVPGVLAPLTLRNYAGSCGFEQLEWFEEALKNRRSDPRGTHVVRQFESYLDSTKTKYIHLVDGGVADNLGMSVLLERMAAMGGVEGFAEVYGLSPPEHVIGIVVNAETVPDPGLSLQSVGPGLSATIGLMSGVQIQRANFETLDVTQRTVRAIGGTLSREDHPVTSHFVEVSFDLADTDEERAYLKHLPTSFRLSDEQVDHLIAAGHGHPLRRGQRYGRGAGLEGAEGRLPGAADPASGPTLNPITRRYASTEGERIMKKLTLTLAVLGGALLAGSAAQAEGLLEAAVDDAEAVTDAAVDTSAHTAGTATGVAAGTAAVGTEAASDTAVTGAATAGAVPGAAVGGAVGAGEATRDAVSSGPPE